MNKIITSIAVAIAVCTGKAACVDWAVSGAAEDNGSKVYLLTSIGDFASAADLAAASVSSAEIASAGRGKYGTPTTTAVNEAVTTTSDYFFAIVASDSSSFNYVSASGLAAKVYDPDLQESSKGTFNSVTAAMIAGGTTKSFGGNPPGPVVPEPTSGLLLLVGMAGIALRRKQK